MPDARISTAALELKTDLSGFKTGLDEAKKIAAGVGKDIDRSFSDTGERLKSLGGHTTDWSKKLEGLVPSWNQVKVAALSALAGVTATAAGLVALGARGAEVNDVTDAFNQLNAAAGQDGPTALAALRAGAGGLLTDFNLMKPLNAALQAGFKMSAQEAHTLARAAWVLSDAQGKDLKGSYETIVQAMATGKVAALASLGLSIEQKGAALELKEALKAEGAEMLSASQRAANRQAAMEALNKVVRAAGDQELDFAEKLERGKVQLGNMVDSLGAAIASSPVMGRAMDLIGDALQRAFGANQTATIQTLVGYVNNAAIGLVSFAQTGISTAKWIAVSFYGIRAVLFDVLAAIMNVVATALDGVASLTEQLARIPVIGRQWAGTAIDARHLADAAGAVADSFQRTGDEAWDAAGKAGASFDAANAQVGAFKAELVEASRTQVDAAAVARNLATNTDEAGEAHQRSAASIKKTAEELAKLTEKVHEIEFGELATPGALGKIVEGVPPMVDRVIERYQALREEIRKLEGSASIVGKEIEIVAQRIVPSMDDLATTVKGTFRAAFSDLPNLLAQGFVGGGGVTGALNALGAQISNGLFGEKGVLAGAMKSAESGLSKFFGDSVGGAFVKAIPVIGGMIGPAVQLIWGGIKKLFGGPSKEELAGRDLVSAFETQLAGMMSAAQKTEAGNEAWKRTVIVIRDAYLAVGKSEADALAAAEALWASSKGGAEESQAAIDEIQRVLDAVATKAEETAADVTDATNQEASALTDLMAAHEARLTDLTKQQQDLLASIADEAEEEVMGVIEQETRAKLAAVEEAIAAENRQAQEKEETAQEAADTTFGIAESLAERLRDMRVTIPVDFAIDESTLRIPGANITGMAAGGIGRVTRPSLFLAGEAGPEDFAFSGAGRSFGGGGGTVTVQLIRDGRREAEWLVPFIPGAVKRLGAI